MLKSVSYAQSVNEERYMLKGVFQFNKDSLSLVAMTEEGLLLQRVYVYRRSRCRRIYITFLDGIRNRKTADVGKDISISFTTDR